MVPEKRANDARQGAGERSDQPWQPIPTPNRALGRPQHVARVEQNQDAQASRQAARVERVEKVESGADAEQAPRKKCDEIAARNMAPIAA